MALVIATVALMIELANDSFLGHLGGGANIEIAEGVSGLLCVLQ